MHPPESSHQRGRDTRYEPFTCLRPVANKEGVPSRCSLAHPPDRRSPQAFICFAFLSAAAFCVGSPFKINTPMYKQNRNKPAVTTHRLWQTSVQQWPKELDTVVRTGRWRSRTPGWEKEVSKECGVYRCAHPRHTIEISPSDQCSSAG